MRKQLLCVALCAALLCAACAPAANTSAESASLLVVAEAAETASSSPLNVTLGEGSFRIPVYVEGDELRTLAVTEADALPALPDDVSADVAVTYLMPATVDQDSQSKTVFTGDEDAFSAFVPRRNGTYTYTVTVGGDGPEYRFAAEVSLPPQIRLSGTGAQLGETLVVYADYADGLTVTATTDLTYKPTFYDTAAGKMAMLPISYYTAPGKYSLTVGIGEEQFKYEISADKRDFVVQNLTVDNSTASSTINNDSAVREWNELIEPLKDITDPQKYWEGTFLMPVQGRITTQFGTIRYTNGSKKADRHGALDIAAGMGTPVPASNSGRVIFAQYIQMSGNVVVIEHGLGVKTWYFHMNEITTKAGDMVKKGDIIGKVGATGFVTGPHLHFGMSVNNVYINPYTAIEKGIG